MMQLVISRAMPSVPKASAHTECRPYSQRIDHSAHGGGGRAASLRPPPARRPGAPAELAPPSSRRSRPPWQLIAFHGILLASAVEYMYFGPRRRRMQAGLAWLHA